MRGREESMGTVLSACFFCVCKLKTALKINSKPGECGAYLWSQLLGKLREENCLNPRVQANLSNTARPHGRKKSIN